MTQALRTLALPLVGAALLGVFAARSGFPRSAFLDGPSLVLVAIGPWLALGFTDSFRAVARTARGLVAAETDAPPARVRVLESRLRALTSFGLGFGVLAAIGALVEGMNQLASLQGQAQPGHSALLYSGYLLGPLYALLLEALLYGPARGRLASERARRWSELEAGA